MLNQLTDGFLIGATLIGCTAASSDSDMTARGAPSQPATGNETEKQTLIALSRQKWRWMAERNIKELNDFFHLSARFVHMGATMDRAAELAVIRDGQIEYRQADISEISVEIVGDTAIIYSQLRLLAVVGGKEVSNPFSVTETYVHQNGSWKLAAMAFTRLLGE